MILSDEQCAAVERIGQDVCVVAGPGSGKTRVLTERFAWLVEQQNIDPERILAITFTEKAATEIKQRLLGRFAANSNYREAIERAWVSTIHGFCARLLRENAIPAGLPPDFAVLEEAGAAKVARDAAEEVLDELFAERADDMRRLLEALDLSTSDNLPKPDLAASLLDVYETMRVAGVREIPAPPPSEDLFPQARLLAQKILDDRSAGGAHTIQLRAWAAKFLALSKPLAREHFEIAGALKAHLNRIGKGPAHQAAESLKTEILSALRAQWIEEWNAGLPDLLRESIARLDRIYCQKKRNLASLDFSDLEEEAIKLLEWNASIRFATRTRFDQVLMDELQDTNRLQWKLIDLIRTPNEFFAVGDINQSIYGFRHAEPAVFEEYRQEIAGLGGVIDDLRENYRSRQEILDAVSHVLHAQPGIEARPLRAAKTFAHVHGPVVERILAAGEDPDAEGKLVAARIRELVESGECKYKDVAILVRSLNSLVPFERALERCEIPFLTTGGRRFLEARESLDLLALLAVLVNPLDEIALTGVLRSPFFGISDEEIYRATREERREIFLKRFGRLRSYAGFLSPDRLIATALDESDYLSGVTPRARANIDKLLGWLRREHHDRPRPLAEMLDALETLRKTQSEAEAPPPEAGDVVRLMSIHAAKGLEFEVVFVSALHRGPDRSKPVIAFSASAGLGARWRNPATGDAQDDTTYLKLIDDLRRREQEEENRLLYVAMTRAENRLILSSTESKRPSAWQKLVVAGVPGVRQGERAREFAASLLETEHDGDQILAQPQIFDQHDSTASVTSIAIFDSCPRKYFLSRYLDMKQARTEDGNEGMGAISLGLEVHRVLAGQSTGGESSEAIELAKKFKSSELGVRATRASRIEREFDFLLAIDDVVLYGIIDLWFEENGELILADYKTGRDESPEIYALQLRLYALALSHYTGRFPDRAVLYYLRSDRPIDVNLTASLEQARAVVRNLKNAQEKMEFPLKEGSHCQQCLFYRGLCPAGKTEN